MTFPIVTLLTFLFSLVILISCDNEVGNGHGSRVKRIANGDEVRSKQLPYAVFIYWYYDHPNHDRLLRYTCTGTILHENWVLTSANCFHDLIIEQNKTDSQTMIINMPGQELNLRAGGVAGWSLNSNRAFPSNPFSVEDRHGGKIYFHTSFTHVSLKYDVDIALIYLYQGWDLEQGGIKGFRRAVKFTKNFPRNGIVLSSEPTFCRVVGWGMLSASQKTPGYGKGEYVTLPDHFFDRAQRYLKTYRAHAGGVEYCKHAQQWLDYRGAEEVDSFYLCAKSSNASYPANTCWGDTGAALICDGKLTGVMSQRRHSSPCGGAKSFSYFTSVGHPEIYNWIKRYMRADTPELKDAPKMSRVTNFPN